MKTARIILIIMVLNVLLLGITGYMFPQSGSSDTYSNILSDAESQEEESFADFMSDDNIVGTETDTQDYDPTALDTRRSQGAIIEKVRHGIRAVPTQAYNNLDPISQILIDVISYVRILSMIVLIILIVMFVKNRKTD